LAWPGPNLPRRTPRCLYPAGIMVAGPSTPSGQYERTRTFLRNKNSDHLVGELEQGFAMDDELTGDGTIILDGESVATVHYWLTVVPVSGPVIAEGSISGSEDVMRKINKATAAQLVLVDGPTCSLRCHGGRSGVRWVKALRP
jgi:hypothetical protein